MPGPDFTYVVDGQEGVMTVAGELDITAAQRLRSVGEAALSDGVRTLVLDLAGVTFIDSTGIGALVHLNNLASARGVALRLTNVSPRVRRPLEITGLAELLGVPGGDRPGG